MYSVAFFDEYDSLFWMFILLSTCFYILISLLRFNIQLTTFYKKYFLFNIKYLWNFGIVYLRLHNDLSSSEHIDDKIKWISLNYTLFSP